MPRGETRGSQNKKITYAKKCHGPCHYNLIKPLFRAVSQLFSIIKNLAQTCFFTNSLNHCPHRCAKKASIATRREQSVIVTSQLLATGSCINDVTIGQHFEPFGAVTG